MEPIATSPISTDAEDDLDLTISTPTGSTEILAQHSLSSDNRNRRSSKSDQENEEVHPRWVPPPDLSAFKISLANARDATSPSSSVELSLPPMRLPTMSRIKASPKVDAGSPLMENAASPTSPTLHLPLPPGSAGATSKRSASMGNTPTSALKTTYMTRKAQHYTSLRKRNINKQGTTVGSNTTLLNRLFCNNPAGGGNNTSAMDDDAPAVSTVSVHAHGKRKRLSMQRRRQRLRRHQQPAWALIFSAKRLNH
jgi:hypothetical protein